MELMSMSWYEVEKAVTALATTLEREFMPDIIVGIARGGLIPAVRLSHLLGDRLLRMIHMKFYKGVDLRRERPEILADVGELPPKVLIVDDVADTGATLELALERVKERGAREVKIATLACKPRSRVKPDYYVFETDKWIVFPWEEMPVTKAGT